MSTALTCEWEMLTFPLPARLKLKPETHRAWSYTNYILKRIFHEACELWVFTVLERWPHTDSFQVTLKGIPGLQISKVEPFFPASPFGDSDWWCQTVELPIILEANQQFRDKDPEVPISHHLYTGPTHPYGSLANEDPPVQIGDLSPARNLYNLRE